MWRVIDLRSSQSVTYENIVFEGWLGVQWLPIPGQLPPHPHPSLLNSRKRDPCFVLMAKEVIFSIVSSFLYTLSSYVHCA